LNLCSICVDNSGKILLILAKFLLFVLNLCWSVLRKKKILLCICTYILMMYNVQKMV